MLLFPLPHHVFRASPGRSWYFLSFLSSFSLTIPFPRLPLLQFGNFCVSCQWSRNLVSSPNFMICSNTDVPQRLREVHFAQPLCPCQIPLDCPTHILVSLFVCFFFVPFSGINLQNGRLPHFSACTFSTWVNLGLTSRYFSVIFTYKQFLLTGLDITL